jgi:ubiquinone/menaquinone biosynthesis C-methylase UbiE
MEQEKTIKYYNERAREYDKVYFRDNPQRQSEIAQLYAMSRRTLADRNVLDIACGTGFWTKIISEKARSITGIDINPATLEEARKKNYLCPIDFIIGDFFDLPFGKDAFDGLLATFVLSHIKRQDINELYNSIRKMVKAGSPVFLCDNNLICEMIPDLIWDKPHINSYKKRRLENGDEYLILKNYFSQEELADRLGNWGTVERIIYFEYYWAVVLTLK